MMLSPGLPRDFVENKMELGLLEKLCQFIRLRDLILIQYFDNILLSNTLETLSSDKNALFSTLFSTIILCSPPLKSGSGLG